MGVWIRADSDTSQSRKREMAANEEETGKHQRTKTIDGPVIRAPPATGPLVGSTVSISGRARYE